MKYTLQIIHHPENGGENVIEIDFDQRYQAEAEERRHRKAQHKAKCETYIFIEPSKG